ncbi:MAG: peroxiredoxin [Candidatus Thorarchaeota archaeon]|nr:peroxiredoxin [Candidatus Thorarchaeota archaeon]
MKVGDAVPDFETVDESGRPFRLSDYRGKKVVLYFYPRDFTPGCTAEACSIRDSYQLFEGAGIPIFGVSGGDAEQHRKFKEKHRLPFPILVDEQLKIAKLYGAYSRLGVVGLGVKRITYLIDEKGTIEGVFGGSDGLDKVRSERHAEQISQFWGLKL